MERKLASVRRISAIDPIPGAVATSESVHHVPIVGIGMTLPPTIAELLAMADGKSALADVPREGLVWKCEQDPSISLKVISNKWLLNEK